MPILNALIALGFDKYVQRVTATGADRLFPDWQPALRSGDFDKDDAAWSNARVIRAFNRTVVPKMLGDRMVPGARQEVTFHSFRGSFKTMLVNVHLNSNFIHEVTGHSKSGLDDRYVGEVPIELTYPAVSGLNFPGLAVPTGPE